jgi:hypothetical protein
MSGEVRHGPKGFVSFLWNPLWEEQKERRNGMETIAVTPEQGRQIIEHLRELEEWRSQRSELFQLNPLRSLIRSLIRLLIRSPKPIRPQEYIEFLREIDELTELGDQVKKQVEQGQVEKPLLIQLNEKLGKIQTDYGNILVFSATIAAIISGLKDLIDLFLGE